MASDVRSALVDLMAATACLNGREAAVKKLSEMQLKGRYLQVKLTAFNIVTV
jgi:sulfite reductase alpha subunit-like flavoprotein